MPIAGSRRAERFFSIRLTVRGEAVDSSSLECREGGVLSKIVLVFSISSSGPNVGSRKSTIP